jgi:hypothetical protein
MENKSRHPMFNSIYLKTLVVLQWIFQGNPVYLTNDPNENVGKIINAKFLQTCRTYKTEKSQ